MYRPSTVPLDPAQLPGYLDQEQRNIAKAMESPVFILQLAESNKEPAKVLPGMVVLADGTNWNPGAGSGYYGYRAGAWRFLG